jgi:hypothetical protein
MKLKYLIVFLPFLLKEALSGFSWPSEIVSITTLALWGHYKVK